MVLVADAHLHGMGHFGFNQAMLDALESLEPEGIELWINDQQAKVHLAERQGRIRIHTYRLSYPRAWAKLWQTLTEGFRLIALIKRGEILKARAVLVLSAGSLGHWMLRLRVGLFPSRVPLWVVYHGELQDLAEERGIQRRTTLFTRACLHMERKNPRALVLGEGIRKGLAERQYPVGTIFSIPHPYRCPTGRPDHVPGSPIRLVAPGGASLEKGSDKLFSVATRIHATLGDQAPDLVDVSMVGTWDPSLAPYDNGMVRHGAAREQLDAAAYAQALEVADFLIYLYPVDRYSLMASGAFLDSLRVGRPVLALRTPWFQDLFASTGDFGRLFDRWEDLADFVAAWATSPDLDMYKHWLGAIEGARAYVSPQRVGEILGKVFR